MNRSTLMVLAIALATVLGFLLWTFDRADMPKPTRSATSAPAATPSTPPAAEHTEGTRPPRATGAPEGGIEVREDGLVATWFAPTTDAPGPALLVLGGSEGGKDTSTRQAARLHAQGYATLALAYFADEGLPPQLVEIPLEYFVGALDWLARQPGVDPERIGVVGGSKGAEAALLLASRDARVRAVVAATPTDYAWQGIDWQGWADRPSWTEGGQPVAYLRYAPFDPAAGLRAMYDRSVDTAPPEARRAARIPLERSAAALLLIAGEDDAMWGAAEASERIAATLAGARHRHEVKVLRYPDAGHVVYVGGTVDPGNATLERFLSLGGTAEGVAAAINDAWMQSLAFLDRHLGPRDASADGSPR